MALIQHTDLAPEGFICNANGQLEPVVKETVTTLVDNGNGTYTYTNEAGATSVITLTTDINVANFSYNSTTKEITLTETDSTVHTISIADLVDVETLTVLAYNATTNELTYTDEDGVSTVITLNNSAITNTVAGNLIATHTSGDGTVTNINETITSLAGGTGDNLLTYTKEDGTTDVIDLSAVLEQYACPNAYFTGTGVAAIQ